MNLEQLANQINEDSASRKTFVKQVVSEETLAQLTELRSLCPDASMSAFIRVASNEFTVKEIATHLDRPYRHVYGVIWRAKKDQ